MTRGPNSLDNFGSISNLKEATPFGGGAPPIIVLGALLVILPVALRVFDIDIGMWLAWIGVIVIIIGGGLVFLNQEKDLY